MLKHILIVRYDRQGLWHVRPEMYLHWRITRIHHPQYGIEMEPQEKREDSRPDAPFDNANKIKTMLP